MINLDVISFITMIWIEYLVMSMNCVFNERVSRRNIVWWYFSVCKDIMTHYWLVS